MKGEIKQIMVESQEKKPDKEEKKNVQSEPEVIFIPSESLDLELIEKTTNGKNEFLQIFKIDTTGEEESKIIFNEKEKLRFEVCCATSQLLVDLKAEYVVKLIIIDQETDDPELFYGQTCQGKLIHRYFKISFNSNANIKGIFRLRAIIQLKASGLFTIYDGYCFRVL